MAARKRLVHGAPKPLTEPLCPLCREPAIPSLTRFGVRHDHCGLWSWSYAPLVDGRTHRARRRAHAAFDPLWQRHGVGRARAYRMLAAELGLALQDCHIKQMDAAAAARVPPAAHRILNQLGKCHD